jgi:hypothetical protein
MARFHALLALALAATAHADAPGYQLACGSAGGFSGRASYSVEVRLAKGCAGGLTVARGGRQRTCAVDAGRCTALEQRIARIMPTLRQVHPRVAGCCDQGTSFCSMSTPSDAAEWSPGDARAAAAEKLIDELAASCAPPSPQVTVAQIAVDPDDAHVDRAALARDVDHRLFIVRSCYERALAREPNAAGRISVHLTLAPAGVVVGRPTVDAPAAIASCVQAPLWQRLRVPAFGGGSATVDIAIDLAPPR